MSDIQYFVFATISMSIPIVLTTLGGVFAERARITNIGMEGLMLISSFVSMAIAAHLNNPWIGMFFGIISSMLFALILALVIFKFNCNSIIAGIGVNLLASGITWLLLEYIYNEPGAYAPSGIDTLPKIRWEFLKTLPFIGDIIYNQSVVLVITVVLIIAGFIVMRYTQFGYWVRAVGQNEDATRAVGIDPIKIKIATLLISGFTAGIAGAFLSTSSMVVFAINMTAGRGFIALGSTIFGAGTVIGSVLAALLFGAAEAASVRLQTLTIPVQFVLMLPYVATIIALTISSVTKRLRTKQDNSYETFVPSITIQR
ncbi:MAG TPA: ABC transporter permease [Anaerolineaceae bacterium]|nr:ABC transporter permease [Chloroflexota bacterium]HNY83651.1 ABC transporter permease [Anaerolineaceae bacterium]